MRARGGALKAASVAGVAALVVGCAGPVEAPFPTTLRPCDLLTTKAADAILGTDGKLSAPKASKSGLFPYAVNVYCTWEYEWPDDLPPQGKSAPRKRRLGIDLVVFGAKSGGAGAAAKDFRRPPEKGQKPVSGVGDEGFQWINQFTWNSGELTFRRSNAIVNVDVTGYDITSDALGHNLPDARLVTMVTQAAQEIDRKFVSLR